MKVEYQTDSEFMRLTVPNTEAQQAELEKSLLAEGCKDPIYIWQNIIVDGHKRYDFCSFEEIDFVVKELLFTTRDEVISWVCRRRLNNLPSNTTIYKYLTGKWYRSLRPKYNDLIKEGAIVAPLDKRGRSRTSKVMAKDIGVGYSSVENREAYAHYMDKIAKSDPDIFAAMIDGKIKVTYRELRMIAKPDPKTRRLVRSRLYPERQDDRNQERGGRKKAYYDTEIMLSTGIKKMPAFDPDMELNGLALTIPSWMASIARAEQKTDMNLATNYAKKQLANNLMRLEEQIHKTLEAIKCTKKEF